MWPFQRMITKLGRTFLKCLEMRSGCDSVKNLAVLFVVEKNKAKPENNQNSFQLEIGSIN